MAALEEMLLGLGARTAVLTDAEGALLVACRGAQTSDADVAELQRLAATYAQSADHAGKLGLGKTQTATAFYEKGVVVHVGCSPLVLTVLSASDANVGQVLDAAPQLRLAVEPLRVEADGVRTTGSVA